MRAQLLEPLERAVDVVFFEHLEPRLARYEQECASPLKSISVRIVAFYDETADGPVRI
ncbi:MAG: hypothetical protein ACM4D3_17655 [Candidatus Sericytochromatia bacterium]